MLSFGSCRVVSPSNRALHITSIGWVIVWLRSCTRYLSFISTDWLSFQSLWSLYWCLLHHRDVTVCILSLCCLHLVTIRRYALVRRKLKPESAIPQLSWLCMSAIPGTVTGSCTLWSSPSTLYSFTEYLVLDDGGCLNSLLPADFIPSTLDHLFWDWNLESFWVPWDLQSSVAGSLTIDNFWEYINVPWSMGSLKFSTSTHLFTLVSFHSSTLIPIFIIGGRSRVY